MTDAVTTPWKLPSTLLPDGVEQQLWSVNGALTLDEVPGARPLPGQFALPGLVDPHAHIALGHERELGMDDALTSLQFSRDHGVLLVRDMGCPGRETLDLPPDPRLPRVIASGMQFAPGAFFPGMEPVPPGTLVAAARKEIALGATWVKVLTDWRNPGLLYPIDEIRNLVVAAHAESVRVAAHCLWRDVRYVADTGVDSIEHGDALDEETLRRMAERGVAWVPTTNAAVEPLRRQRRLLAEDNLGPERRKELEGMVSWAEESIESARRMVPLAVDLGVIVLPSTDAEGTVVDEIERFVEYGIDRLTALRLATTIARDFLGAEGLEPGAPADVVTFEMDPREDVRALRRPAAILLRGHRIH